jgi:hypothetical protein
LSILHTSLRFTHRFSSIFYPDKKRKENSSHPKKLQFSRLSPKGPDTKSSWPTDSLLQA